MENYVAMLRTDADDRDITEWGMLQTGQTIPVRFISDKKALDEMAPSLGKPLLILVNDRGAAHAGFDQLRQLKADPAYDHIPVIVLGEMSTDDYIRECYRAGANSFIIKPSSIEDTKSKISHFFNYWLNVAAV